MTTPRKPPPDQPAWWIAHQAAHQADTEYAHAYRDANSPRARRNRALMAAFVVIGGSLLIAGTLAALWINLRWLGIGLGMVGLVTAVWMWVKALQEK